MRLPISVAPTSPASSEYVLPDLFEPAFLPGILTDVAIGVAPPHDESQPPPLCLDLGHGRYLTLPMASRPMETESASGRFPIAQRVWQSTLPALEALKLLDLGEKSVLEVGCGTGALGLAAGLLGAGSVTLTDCDDRALSVLTELLHDEQTCGPSAGLFRGADHGALPVGGEGIYADVNSLEEDLPRCRDFLVRHHLWEEDLPQMLLPQFLPHEERLPPPPTPQGHATTPRPREGKHWSNIVRNLSIPSLDSDETFDLVIASDCLYFASQEIPLAAVLKRRMKNRGNALVVVQTRNNGGNQLERFVALLREEHGVGVEVRAVVGGGRVVQVLEAGGEGQDGQATGVRGGESGSFCTMGSETAQHVLWVKACGGKDSL